MAGDLNFKVNFETEAAANTFKKLFQEYVNGSQRAGDEANRLLGGTLKKNVEVRLTTNAAGAKELTTIVKEARTELDKYEKQYRNATRVEPGSLTAIRQQLNQARQARDAIKQYSQYVTDASGKQILSIGDQTPKFTAAQQKVKDLEFQLKSLAAVSGSAFDRIKFAFNLDNLFNAGKQLADIVAIFQSLEIAVGALTAPIKAATTALADLQSFGLSFKAIGTGASGATIALQDAADIALGLGVNIKTVREGFQQLSPVILNSGGSLSDVNAVMEALSSRFAAFGLNADKSRRVMNGIIQAFAKGKLMAEELTQQISEADPAFKTDFAKALNVSTQELERMVKAGEINSQVLLQTLPALSKSALLYGKLGDSASSAVDALKNGSVILSQVQAAIANIGQLNLEKFAKFAEPLVISFLNIQAAITDFLSRIMELDSVKAIIGILTAVSEEAQRIASVFLKVAEGFLIVINPIAKLINTLLEIPGVSTIVGLAIVGNLIKPLQSFGAAIATNLGQQKVFGQQIGDIWKGVLPPIAKVQTQIDSLNNSIKTGITGLSGRLFAGGKRDAQDMGESIQSIGDTSNTVKQQIIDDAKAASTQARAEVTRFQSELNDLRKSSQQGTFIPTGQVDQRSLRDLRSEAAQLQAQLTAVGQASATSRPDIEMYGRRLNEMFSSLDPVRFNQFSASIASLRTTQPVEALGLLQSALRQLRRDYTEAVQTLGSGSFTAYTIDNQIRQTKRLITELVGDFRSAGQEVPRAMREIGTSVRGTQADLDRLNADRLIGLQQRIAEGESQIAGQAMALRSSLTSAQQRLEETDKAASDLALTTTKQATPAIKDFDKATQLLARQRDLENRLQNIRTEYSNTVRSILSDSRLVGKATLPGSPLSSGQAASALQATEERGTRQQQARVEALNAAYRQQKQAVAEVVPELKAVQGELLAINPAGMNLHAISSELTAAGETAAVSTNKFSMLGGVMRVFSGVGGAASLVVRGLTSAVSTLWAALGPVGVAMIAVQVITEAWRNGTKGMEKALKEGSTAVDIYKTALDELANVSLQGSEENVNMLALAWNTLSLNVVDAGRKIGNEINVLLAKIDNFVNNPSVQKFFKDIFYYNGKPTLIARIIGLDQAIDVNKNKFSNSAYAIRQFQEELRAAGIKSSEASVKALALAKAIDTLGAAAAKDPAAKQRQIDAYVALTNGIAEQQKVLEKYQSQLNELNLIEQNGGKLTDEQAQKKKMLNDRVYELKANLSLNAVAADNLAKKYGYLKEAVKASAGSITNLSAKLKDAKELLENSAPNSAKWKRALVDISTTQFQLDKLKKQSESPIDLQKAFRFRGDEIRKELDSLILKYTELYNKEKEATTYSEKLGIRKDIIDVLAKIDQLKKELNNMRETWIYVKLKYNLDVENFQRQVATIQRQLSDTQILAKVNATTSPELRSSLTLVQQIFRDITTATNKISELKGKYKLAIAAGDTMGQVEAARELAIASEEYKLKVSEGSLAIKDAANDLKQKTEDAKQNMLSLKLGNMQFLPPEMQKEAIQELNKEVQKLAEQKNLKVSFTGTTEEITQAKMAFVSFWKEFDKQTQAQADLSKATNNLEEAGKKVNDVKLGDQGELFATALGTAAVNASNIIPQVSQIADYMNKASVSTNALAASILSLDGKVITVKINAKGIPGKFAGGPVKGGATYRVNELGQEGFLSPSGRLTAINKPRNALWKPTSSGTVIPASVFSQLKVPKTGVSVSGGGKVLANASSGSNGMNALARQLVQVVNASSNTNALKNEIAATHAAQALEIGKLTTAVRQLVDKDWNVDVNIKNSNNKSVAYMNALNRMI